MRNRLKQIRENLGKTQKEMSELLGLGIITWQNYERGITKPKIETLEKLSSMGYNFDWITSGRGDMFNSQVEEKIESAFILQNNVLDRVGIFNMLLNELQNIYTEKDLQDKPKNYLSLKAFNMTMNICNLADDNTTAINMVKLEILEEKHRKK